jgi:hypothetical protein
MTRTMEAAVTSAVQDDRISVQVLASFDFDGGLLRFWDGIGDVTVATGGSADGTYTGAGNLADISPIEEASGTKATGLEFVLSGLNSGLVSTALGEHYQGRAVNVWFAFYNTTTKAILNHPLLVFAGRMNVMAITDTGLLATIALTAESRFIDLQRAPNPLFYTNDDQIEQNAGDVFFEFIPDMAEKVILWGKNVMRADEWSPPVAAAPPSDNTPAASGGDTTGGQHESPSPYEGDGGSGGSPGSGGSHGGEDFNPNEGGAGESNHGGEEQGGGEDFSGGGSPF